MNKYVTETDLQNAINMAKARVYHYQQIGWTMFSRADLLSAANEGIAEALVRFEPSKGSIKDTKFTSYAYFWIEKYIKEYITHNKTMLTGTAFELWTGAVPYTISIDAYDDPDRDEVSSDHKDWLGTSVSASANIEASQRQRDMQALLSQMLMHLEPAERLVMQLSIGIGTVFHKPMTIPEIAKATKQTKKVVEQLMQAATSKMQAAKSKYKRQYANM